MTCKDCIHYDACKSMLESLGYAVDGDGENADERCKECVDKSRLIEVDDNLETMLICAVRYACGRKSYMPGIVAGYIKPLIPRLSGKALGVIRNDISFADKMGGGLGDAVIDAPLWRNLQHLIDDEIERRTL